MKKLILFLLSIACGGVIQSNAQSTPLYVCQPPDPMDILPQRTSGPFQSYTSSLHAKTQNLYYQTDFLNMDSFVLGMPKQGTITDIYFKLYSARKKGDLIKDLTIKINDTTLLGFSQGQSLVQSGLTTVFYDSLYSLQDSIAKGDWWRITLQTPYHYSFSTHPDSCKSLLFEIYGHAIKQDDINSNAFFDMYSYTNSKRPLCNLIVDSVTQNFGASNFLLLIGFNPLPDPVSVQEVHPTNLSLYPNPAKTTIHFSLKGSYTISTLQGAIVKQGKGDVADIGNLPQGLYMVQLTTKNGERLVGRFLKE